MFDCHIHTGLSPVTLTPTSPREDRDRFADWLRELAPTLGIDRFCAIMQTMGTDVETCRKSNRTMAALVRENPDLLHGWARVNPEWEDATREFRRAIEEDGLLGLKLTYEVKCDDPRVFPLAEAAIDMDVPVKIHTMQRVERREELPNESFSDEVLALAEEYPDLKILASHIGGGGDWEYRIKNIQHQENVFLDISGSVCDAGMVEMAAEYLGTDRLVFGTDNSLYSCVGKLHGSDLTPEERGTIAYNMASLLRGDDPYGYSDEELADLREKAVERFRESDRKRASGDVVDANAYLGHWPFRELDASADGVLETMDETGIDTAVVSSLESVCYRDVHPGNRTLAAAIDGHEDRFVPFATVNPRYAAWEEDLEECVEELGMQGVKLLPNYHDYDLDDPAAVELGRRCADLGVPVMLVATLEDQRGRHPRFELRGFEDFRGKPARWRDEQVDAVVSFLLACPRTDVVVTDAWQDAYRIKTETLHERRAMVADGKSGDLLFVLGDLFIDHPGQLEKVVNEIGTDHLVSGPGVPLTVFESGYVVPYLPVDDDAADAVRSGNLRSLLD
ncbi:amidohydrolase family protein [Haladaptatus sp. CMAA 1911]|uniref:amidohydrolase family protein n=1 Tax=unclassified Haladaptatus TaxID=2622732 RepID=UPI0037553A2B